MVPAAVEHHETELSWYVTPERVMVYDVTVKAR